MQRTMLELVNQLDGFDPRGNMKVLMATNRPDTLDPALMRPGRLDRKVEFSLPDLEGRTNIFKIHARSRSLEKDIRYSTSCWPGFALTALEMRSGVSALRPACSPAGQGGRRGTSSRHCLSLLTIDTTQDERSRVFTFYNMTSGRSSFE